MVNWPAGIATMSLPHLVFTTEAVEVAEGSFDGQPAAKTATAKTEQQHQTVRQDGRWDAPCCTR